MRTALLLDIEELLFDTHAIRTSALHDALSQEGATIDTESVSRAHLGVPAALALQPLAPMLTLDATGIDLVLHRAAEHASRIFALHSPSFDAESRDALAMLSGEFPVAVVTRASGADAHGWLAASGLDAAVTTVRSLAGLDPSEYVGGWADALRRSRAERGVAIAAPAMLRSARSAGLRTVQFGADPDPSGDGYHPDAQIESLPQLRAALLAML